MSAATVLNRVLDFWCGHKLNRVGKITDFGDKYEKGFGKQAALLHCIFLGVPLGYYEVVHKYMLDSTHRNKLALCACLALTYSQ